MKDFRNRDVDFREIMDGDKYTLDEKFDAIRREDCWFDAMLELEETGGIDMKYYLIYNYNDYTTYTHEFDTEKQALKEFNRFRHVVSDECKIILAKGRQLNKEG